MMIRLLLALAVLAVGTKASAGEFLTEVGMGVKLEKSTSFLLLPACHTALVTAPKWPDNPRGAGGEFLADGSHITTPNGAWSCGGDDPTFIGWPIAYEWDVGKHYSVRAGWFHYSNWFDGGHDRETHMDVIAMTVTIHWGSFGRR